MNKVSVFFIFCLVLFLFPQLTIASDLPIDITAIDQIGNESRKDAVTARFEADLFSSSSAAVNAAIVNQERRWRETTNSSLFNETVIMQEFVFEQHLLSFTANSDLFSEPMQFRRISSDEGKSGIPLWSVISVFAICAIGGFVSARVILWKKEQKAYVSQFDYENSRG